MHAKRGVGFKAGKIYPFHLRTERPGLDSRTCAKSVSKLTSPFTLSLSKGPVRSWFDNLTTNGPRTDKDTQDWEYPENHQIRQILIQTITLPKTWT